MAKTRIHLSIERALLDDFKQLAGNDANISTVISDGIRYEIRRLRTAALPDDLDDSHPAPLEDQDDAIDSPSATRRSRVDNLRAMARINGRTRVIDISDPDSW